MPSQNTKSSQAKTWSKEIEEAYRFKIAGYRDEAEYKAANLNFEIERWPESGFVKKLRRKDGSFFYYNRERECPQWEIMRLKLFEQ
ncbi:unnamed protein product [Dibothriocephalus latus]|uniref:Meiosis expressed gene 1 protein homolog n=1 Tax=Dibothriocephalus latus TaxID=60516 RepID=A0A3P7NSE9_DIBLA|nr:unnamed protein product [Dibothriocephalus latus]